MRKPKARQIIHCVYTRNKHNFVSECGHRAKNVHKWVYCPWCGRRIGKLWNVMDDEDDEEVAD